MIRLIEDTRKTFKMSLERFFYMAYFYAELKISTDELFDLLDWYNEEGMVNSIILDFAYDLMCGVAKPIDPSTFTGGSHGKRKTA